MNKNCHNSRTIHDIDMKLGRVTEIDKENTTSKKKKKKKDDTTMSRNFDTIAFFPIYGQFVAIWKPDSMMHGL